MQSITSQIVELGLTFFHFFVHNSLSKQKRILKQILGKTK